jgi:hypothetical protein
VFRALAFFSAHISADEPTAIKKPPAA